MTANEAIVAHADPQTVSLNERYISAALQARERHDFSQAVQEATKVLATYPQHILALTIAGVSLLDAGDAVSALPYLQQSLNIQPQNAALHWEVARALCLTMQHEQALFHFEQAQAQGLSDRALDNEACSAAVAVYCQLNYWLNYRDEQSYQRTQHYLKQGALFFGCWVSGECILASPYFDNALLLLANQRYAKSLKSQFAHLRVFEHPVPEQTPSTTKRKIRIGFVGSDFYKQATAYLMVGFIEQLDRDRFEVFAYEHGMDHSREEPFRQRVIEAYDHFVRIEEMTDDEAAARIHHDGIDVLFSIKAPSHARLGIFFSRPARIQVHYLYYPSTSGFSCFDYIIADDVVIPEGYEAGYSEQILRLAGCYQPNDARRLLAKDSTHADWGLPADAIVLANFNQASKHNPLMFDLWCGLLKSDQRRVLWLYAINTTVQERFIREANKRGITADRLFFGENADVQIYLNRMRFADLIVDTYPYGGHTVTSDALWSGTPVLTLCGQTFASRVAASILNDVGMDELIAYSELEYVRKAEALLNSPEQRQHWRNHLDQGRQHFSVFDSRGYARRFEDAVDQLIASSRATE